MWGKRPKRNKRLSKRETLGLLADLMAQAEEEQGGEPETVLPYYQGAALPIPPARRGLRIVDVPVDNSAGPEPSDAADEPEPQTPVQRELPAQRRGESSRHGSF
jgi:hypothetical protein